MWSSSDPGEVTGQTLGYVVVVVLLLAGIVVGTGVAVEFISSLNVSNILQLGATGGTFEAGDAGWTTCSVISECGWPASPPSWP